ncbi:unnamed protein product [Nezara viridula]|uniref:Hyaluronidase n=1 Tax=Nezara viridula TaxID=85310 RepID=A0A9P0HDP1_NEZVI|nr:unnamed protein product [Nezara viridula]
MRLQVGVLVACLPLLPLFGLSLEEPKEYIFPVYWNVPTFQCHKYGLNFSRVKDWGLQQNYQDEFRGEEIAILYDPGEFPALLPASGGRRIQRNGGVPQEGSLTRHLSLFQGHLEKLIPNVNFSGLAIIDFEHWRPVWRQNWGSLSPYRDFSRLIEKRRHPFWFSSMVEVEATYRYELGARVFLLDTLRLGKKLRPLAKWGYYGFPFCFNYTPYNNRAACSYEVQLDNDNMYWLFSETTAYYPSLYLKYNDMYSTKRQRFIKGRLEEAMRVAQEVPVYPYVWYKYHDNHQFITKEDMVNLLKIPKDYGCKGAVIWGASRDVNSREKCIALQSYLDEVIGPAVKDLHEETFREGISDHEVDENSEEEFDEDDMELKEKILSYDVRDFEV